MEKRKGRFKDYCRYLWDYTDFFLDTWLKKIFFALAFITAQLLVLYITAFFDVLGKYPKDLETSISGLIAKYRLPGAHFPWGVFLVLSLVIDFTAVLIIWKHGAPPGGRNFELSKNNTYGSGREISRRELAKMTHIGHKDALVDTIYGQLDDTGKHVLARKTNKPNNNMLVFGPPGSGKSTSYVLPFITQAILRRESVCVSDTKGEVYAKTAELARRHGYRVLRLDLKNPACSDGWNVLKELRNDDVRALIFAKTVMANTNTDGGKDIHAAPEESLLKACCLFQERVPNLAESQRTFYNAFAMLLQSPDDLDSTFMSAFASHGECMQVVMDAYSTFLQGSPNLRGNIITGLANRLGVLASPPVREMTSTDGIDFARLGLEPTILYISMSDQHQTMSFLASLAFSFAFLDLVDLADHSKGQRLKVPVHFLMEEFGNLGYIPNIDKYLSTARSRGISINLVIQSLAQLQGTYEENMTNIILADCALWMCLACNDESTAELLSWRSGEATIKVKTTQHDAMEPPVRLSHRNSTGDGRRNFYTPNDIMKIQEQKEALIIWQSKDSLKCLSFPIFQHQEFAAGRMPEISADSLIPLSNKKAKRLFLQWEEERIRSFRTWMAAGGDPLRDYKVKHKTKDGPAAGTDIPDITPIHTLERMALAQAEGRQYDPRKDPDSPEYIEPEENDPYAELVAGDVWDMTGWVFEKETAEEKPSEMKQSTFKKDQKGQGRNGKQNNKPKPPKDEDTPRPTTTADVDLAREAAEKRKEEEAAAKAAAEEFRKQEEARMAEEQRKKEEAEREAARKAAEKAAAKKPETEAERKDREAKADAQMKATIAAFAATVQSDSEKTPGKKTKKNPATEKEPGQKEVPVQKPMDEPPVEESATQEVAATPQPEPNADPVEVVPEQDLVTAETVMASEKESISEETPEEAPAEEVAEDPAVEESESEAYEEAPVAAEQPAETVQTEATTEPNSHMEATQRRVNKAEKEKSKRLQKKEQWRMEAEALFGGQSYQPPEKKPSETKKTKLDSKHKPLPSKKPVEEGVDTTDA